MYIQSMRKTDCISKTDCNRPLIRQEKKALKNTLKSWVLFASLNFLDISSGQIYLSVTFDILFAALTCPFVCLWRSFTLINLYNLLLSALSSAVADSLRGEKKVSLSVKQMSSRGNYKKVKTQ